MSAIIRESNGKWQLTSTNAETMQYDRVPGIKNKAIMALKTPTMANALMFIDELQDMTQADRNCLSHDIAIERAKNKLRQLVSSPNTRLVNEYTALVQKEFAAIEGFIYDSKIPQEDVRGLYDALKAKYGIDPDIELGSYVSDKLDIIVEAGRELNTCPCCGGVKMHIMSERDDGNQEYLCQTCKGTGKLA